MIDTTTWTALGLTLTLIGLVVSVVLWRRRGAASGLRAAAWSLLPAAAGLTGVLHLLADIVSLVLAWAARLVFSPVVWLGVAVTGLSVVLFAVSAGLRRRGRRKPVGSAGKPAAVEAKPGGAPAGRAPADEDLDEIEAILRKHGIS